MSAESTNRKAVLPTLTPGVARTRAAEKRLSLESPALYLAVGCETYYVALDENGLPVTGWREDQHGSEEFEVDVAGLRQLVETADVVRQTTVLHTPGWTAV